MNNTTNIFRLVLIILLAGILNVYSQTTIDQKLSVYFNSGTNNGVFSIDYKIKGTQLTEARTLGSLSADIVYDSSVIQFTDITFWNEQISRDNGYEKFVSKNSQSGKNNFIRIVINALYLNNDSSNSQQGYTLGNDFNTVARLNFIILDYTKSVSLSINSVTNQTGLFANPANNPNTFEINDQLLSPPELIIDEALPVMLADFNSIVRKDNVTLKWVTTSEHNNEGFKVERKEINNQKWIIVGERKGAGNSNARTEYSFDDVKLQSGKYNYRIKQVDNNGNFKYYSLNNFVEVGIPAKFNLSQNYPNPFNPMTKINYELPQDSKVNITIFDILGREMLSLVNQEQKAGYYTITADSKNLASGTYFYRLIAKSSGIEFVMSKKMSIVK